MSDDVPGSAPVGSPSDLRMPSSDSASHPVVHPERAVVTTHDSGSVHTLVR